MKTIYESYFLRVKHSHPHKLMEIVWRPASLTMSKSQYKKEYLAFLEIYNKYHVEKLLVNESMMMFELNNDLRKWITKVSREKIEVFAKQVAIVLTSDYIQELNVKKLMAEPEFAHVNTLYFERKADAEKWLVNGRLENAYQIAA
ncbi:MAG: hypothetical protein CMO01_27380 [Thalassobius sp.]|nr:hypothetical protein [Thalassovita sp.]